MEGIPLVERKVGVLVIDLGDSIGEISCNSPTGRFNPQKLANVESLLKYARERSLPRYAVEYCDPPFVNLFDIEAMNFYKTKTTHFDRGEELIEAVKTLSEKE